MVGRASLGTGLAIGALVAAAYLAIGVHQAPESGVAVDGRDAYLAYQYAAAWSDGRPYVFTPGDAPTTGSTSHLYPALLGAFHALGARGDALSVVGAVLAAASLLACIALVAAIARRVAPEAQGLAVLAVAASGHLAATLFGQTDALVVAPLALGAFAALLYRRHGWLTALLVALPFARPDAVVVALALLVVAATWRVPPASERRALLRAGLLGVASFGAVLALDFALTGQWLPQGTQAKGLFHVHPPAGALALGAQAAAKLFAELVLGMGDGARRMLWLPGVAGVLALAGGYARSADAAAFDRVFALAALGLLALGILGGSSGIHRDRYLVWVLPIAFVYVAIGAAAVARWLRQPRLLAWLATALVGFQALGAAYMAGAFATGAAAVASSVRFAKQIDERLPEGARIGVASGAGLAYFMPRHAVTNVNGIVSSAFAHPHPNVVGIEILRANPQLRFDYWLLRPASLGSGWYRTLLGAPIAREEPEVVGADPLMLFPADASSLAEPDPAALEVGLPASERAHGYAHWLRTPGVRIEPALVAGRLEGLAWTEAGRVILGGESFRVERPVSGRLALALRTASQADAVVRVGARSGPQRFHFEAPLALSVRVDGREVATPSLPLVRDDELVQRLRFEVDVPDGAASGELLHVEIRGDYLSLGWEISDANARTP